MILFGPIGRFSKVGFQSLNSPAFSKKKTCRPVSCRICISLWRIPKSWPVVIFVCMRAFGFRSGKCKKLYFSDLYLRYDSWKRVMLKRIIYMWNLCSFTYKLLSLLQIWYLIICVTFKNMSHEYLQRLSSELDWLILSENTSVC